MPEDARVVPLEAGEEAEGLTQPGVEAGEAGSVLVQAPLLAPSHRLHLVQEDYLIIYPIFVKYKVLLKRNMKESLIALSIRY